MQRAFMHLFVLITVAFICLIGSSMLFAQELVTRNDFVCQDSTLGDDRTRWPAVAIDTAGMLSVVYFDLTYDPAWDNYMSNIIFFDRNGNQTQPATAFLPDTVNLDTIWLANSLIRIYNNDAGVNFIPYYSVMRPESGPNRSGIFFVRFDGNGQMLGDRVHAGVYEDHPYFNPSNPYGSINDQGVIGAAWYIQGDGTYNFDDSVLVRLYYPATDSLSPYINPTSLPHPLTDDPDWDGDLNTRQCVSMALANDGSFAVAWILRDLPFQHVCYVVYNSDYSPRCDVTMADCDGVIFSDTANCITDNVMQLDIAMETDGDFYIVWTCTHLDAPDYYTRKHFYMRGFYPDGTPKYDAVRVDDADSTNMSLGQLRWPSIACDDIGNVMVLWSDARNFVEENWFNSEKMDLFAQKIDPDGNLVGPNCLINDVRGWGDLYGASSFCAMNNAGQSVITWCSRESGHPGISLAQLMPYHDIGTFIPGDVNLDLQCDIDDVVHLITYIFADTLIRFWPRDLPNLNGDGAGVDIDDLVYLINYIFSGGPKPVTPYEGIRPSP